MTIESIKKYSLTDEEIEAVKTTFKVVSDLRYGEFDDYGEFYSSGISIEDAREILKMILENNNKNLEQRYSLFFFLISKCWISKVLDYTQHFKKYVSRKVLGKHRYARLRGNITKKTIDFLSLLCYNTNCQGERERTPNRLRIVRVATNSRKKM